MNTTSIALIKKILLFYWLSVIVVASLFLDSNLGLKYVLVGFIIFLIHVVETFLFHSILEEYSDNIFRDKCLMLPFGYLIPAGLKARAQENNQKKP